MSMSSVDKVLMNEIENELVEVNELEAMGHLGAGNLYNRTVMGILSHIPMKKEPFHILVLKQLTKWHVDGLINMDHHEHWSDVVKMLGSTERSAGGS